MSKDFEVCPFHKFKCEEINKNRQDIEEMKQTLATKDDFKILHQAVEKRMPIWTLSALILIVMGIIGYLIYDMRGFAAEAKTINTNVSTLKANQNILLRAFNIAPVEQPKEVENE